VASIRSDDRPEDEGFLPLLLGGANEHFVDGDVARARDDIRDRVRDIGGREPFDPGERLADPLTPTMRFHSSSGASSTGPSSIVPALFPRVSSRPGSATVRSTAPRASSSSVISARSESALPPAEPIVSASVSRRSVRRAARATAAPRRARASAAASPMPLEAPVTRATVPPSVSAALGQPRQPSG
jgi:hypothetical protein